MLPIEEGSVNLETLLIILNTVFAYLLIGFLWIGKSKENRGNLFLSLMILQLSLYFLPEFLSVLGLLDDFPHAVRIYVIGSFLLGPITYFYVRTCIEKEFKVTWRMGWHFLPTILDFLYQLPFYTLPGEEKLQFFYNFFTEGFQQPPILTLVKVMHVLLYVCISIRLIFKYNVHLKDATSSIDAAFHRWLLFFCLAAILPSISTLVYIFTTPEFAYIFLVLSTFFAILTAFSLLIIKPTIFLRFPHRFDSIELERTPKNKYVHSKLQTDQKDRFLQKLITFVEKEKSYQSPELTLAELSQQVDIPAHYLSQVINEKLQVNFLDFINKYRVNAAKEKLLDPKLSHYTILAIAFEAGFNAKSTFYAAFKKHTGMTPSQYRLTKKVG